MHRIFRLLGLLVVCTAALPVLGADNLTSHLAAISSKLDPRAAAAIHRLDGTGRQLLAARSYLRYGDSLADKWSWSQQEIDAYRDSPAQRLFDSEINSVRQAFESRNPGYTLFVNPNVRSLDIQIEQWNSNESVAAAAAELQDAVTTFLAAGALARASTAVGRDRFANFLMAYTPLPAPTIAAPGLSLHGQMRAVDFQVESAGNTVAGPDTLTIDSIWLQGGWRDKLLAAVIASVAMFVGPLENPDEPWHYTYLGPLALSTAGN